MAKGERKNYHTIRYGQRDGEIKFGHITDENEQTAVMLRSGWAEGLHYFQMYHTGKKGVLNSSPEDSFYQGQIEVFIINHHNFK